MRFLLQQGPHLWFWVLQVAVQRWRVESLFEAAASKTVMLSCRLNRCIDPTDTTVVPDLLLLGLQAGEAVCQIEVEIEIRLD